MCDSIYIGNKQQKSKKIIDGNFSNVQRIIKTDKNQTYLMPIMSKTLNIIRHALNYAILWCSG